MTEEQQQAVTKGQRQIIAEAWKMLHSAFPDAHGSIRLNLQPERDYANVNLELGLALEFDGTIIKNLGNRNTDKR